MRKRRVEEDPKPSAPFWMTTYGDMVTNLLVFFVLLFSFSTIDAEKWRQLVLSFAGSSARGSIIGTEVTPEKILSDYSDAVLDLDERTDDVSDLNEQTDPEAGDETANAEVDKFNQLYIKIKGYVEEGGLDGQLELIKTDAEILIRFRDNVIFDSGKADIRPEAEGILDEIASVLLLYEKEIDMIRVEGHTDNVPIHTEKYPSNWELSTARAVEVLRYFIEKKGLDPLTLSAVGYGEYHPVRENDTSEGRAVNRRVDIVIAKAVDSDQ